MNTKDWKELGEALYYLNRAALSYLRINFSANPWAKEAYDDTCKIIKTTKTFYLYDKTD